VLSLFIFAAYLVL